MSPKDKLLQSHRFALVLAGIGELDAASEDALFEAGCDDAILGLESGVPYLEFDREAASFPEAVLSAIEDVRRADVATVVRIEPDDLVTASEIARRSARSRESIRQLIEGLRGPGTFPRPVHSLRARSPLWRWSEVAEWMRAKLPDSGVTTEMAEDAAFVAVMNQGLALTRPTLTLRVHKRFRPSRSKARHASRPDWERLLD